MNEPWWETVRRWFLEPWNSTKNKPLEFQLKISPNESSFSQKWTIENQNQLSIFSAQFPEYFQKSDYWYQSYSTFSTSTYSIWESDTRPKNVLAHSVDLFTFLFFMKYIFSEGYAENYASHTAEALSRVTQGALKKPNRRISVGLSQNGISLSVEDLRRRKTRIVVVGQENVGKSG